MLFNSFQFLIFFPVVTVGYFFLPHRFRWLWLLAASCYFYMCFIPVYILILFFTIGVDYFAGIAIANASGVKRKRILLISILANLGVLAFFKYFNFFNANLESLAHAIGWNYPVSFLRIILPIGLSFHTFQSLSYTIEVYRKNQPAERNPGIFALYVMFYPQLVAGPIERPQNLLHQFYEKHDFDYERVRSGLALMVWGLFKKVVIADRLCIVVDQVYNHAGAYKGVPLILATIFFSIQIYCDFSGYSDIARGSARVMGFRLMENFRAPYLASTIAEFWSRWHISLSTWFRDYVYIPLGGNRVSKIRWMFNLLLTFMLSGLWHGASWTFVIWGTIHGSFVILAHLTKLNEKKTGPRPFHVLSTYLIVCFAWIFFRANSVSDAFYIVASLFQNLSAPFSSFLPQLGFTRVDWIVILLAVSLMFKLESIHGEQDFLPKVLGQNTVVRWAVYSAALFAIVVFGVFRGTQFIYFQF